MFDYTDLNEFIEVLHILDYEIDKNNYNDIEIKAIGGFALIINAKLNCFKSRVYTRDIDSLTDNYPEEIQILLSNIGFEMDLPGDWLNNKFKRSKESENLDNELIVFKEYNNEFKHIKLFYADLESLFDMKMNSIEDKINLAQEIRKQDEEKKTY